MASDLDIADKRIEFLADYILKSQKLKGDKWAKLWSVEDNQLMITEFLDKADRFQIYFTLSPSGLLTISTDLPTSLKSKATFFVKKGKENLGKDANLSKLLVYGDLTPTALDSFSNFVDEFVLPLLKNRKNHKSWPEVVSEDVIKHVHHLKRQTDVVLGQAKGKTLLPMPINQEPFQDSHKSIDRSTLYSIETLVIEWSHQVHKVLIQDSAQGLEEGKNVMPLTELDFWVSRQKNLNCIYEQMTCKNMRNISEILEINRSSYFRPFQEMFKSVVTALREAQDITLHLKPLRPVLEEFEQVELEHMYNNLAPILELICLVWANSTYYRMPGRVVVLLKEICNLLILQVSTHLDGAEILKGEPEETIEKVEMAVKIVHHFKNSYHAYRNRLPEFFEEIKDENGENVVPVLWEFTEDMIFDKLDDFIKRLEQVQFLMKTALEFLKLEKVELSGLMGRDLSPKVVQILEEFQTAYKVFGERSYDALDHKNQEFEHDFDQFNRCIEDFDRRLGTICCQTFDDCSSIEHYFKVSPHSQFA
ncbi:hypothetical protein Ciccas_005254 [Cichlidogyrus casuarinus]|uniref:Dynein heavy chain tail domain-containing protein n=1 Tax=Cichlidogyrus casuarinus TaxID=1844966 RepID=A0ABD2QCR6_9PLAT